MSKFNLADYCECGCGQRATISPYTNSRLGYVKGQPRRFIRGHNRKVEGFTICKTCGSPKERDSRCKVCWAAYMRDWRTRKPEKSKQRIRERTAAYGRVYREANPEKARAHWTLNNAARSGRVQAPDACVRCGAVAPLHGHHWDYSKPLDVEWVCVPCHIAIHLDVAA